MKLIFVRPSYVILLSVFTLFGSGCSQQADEEAPLPLRQVRSVLVETGSGMSIRSFSGTLQSSQETSLSFKVSGTIQDILVEVGDKIKPNDVIASLDPSSFALVAQQAQAALAEANSQLKNAQSRYERTKKLYEAGNSSKNDLDDARAAEETAKAATQSASRALEIAQLDLSYTKLQAENECAIATVEAEQGENVALGTQIFLATCGEGFEVSLSIPESVISHIDKGMSVSVSFPAIPKVAFTGKVFEVGVSSVQGGTTFPVTIALENKGNSNLKAGLSAEVEFNIASNKSLDQTPTVVVPPFAVGEDQNGRFVFVLDTQTEEVALVRKTPVTIGQVQQGGIEILQGVQAGARLVTAGVSVLRDGMEVKYSND